MDLDRFIQRALRIQSIPAPTFQETARASLMEAELLSAGVPHIEHDAAGNLYGRIPGGLGLPLIMAAHLDTVFPQEIHRPAVRHGDRLIGPGIGDNAIGLAALVELALDHAQMDLPGDLWLVATVGEEGLGNLRGMQQVVERFGAQVAGYLAIEGMVLGHVYHRGLPVCRYRISVNTEGGHSWIHAGRRISAIHTVVRICQEILRIRLPKTPRTTLNVGKIAGGTSVNSIASDASMEIDLRSEDPKTLRRVGERLERIAQYHRSEGLRIQIEKIGERPAGGLPASHPLVQAARQAMLDVGQPAPRLEAGSTDASLPLSLGFPAICIGITRGGDAHTTEEFAEIAPIPLGYLALRRLVKAAYELDTD